MMTGVTTIDTGRILINGFDISKTPLDAKRQFGFVPDSPDMFLRLKGIEYLNFMADIYEVPGDVRRERIEKMASLLGMIDALGDKIQAYSHGMRQKIVLMGALLHQPKVWILDEPLTGLDPKSSYLLKEMMKEHAAKGNVVFFSTHVLEVAEKLCDQVGIIDRGNLLFTGTLDEMKAHFAKEGSLESIFLELTEHA
jgi:ABC-2 type transport system ATP-binding protein